MAGRQATNEVDQQDLNLNEGLTHLEMNQQRLMEKLSM